MDNKGTLPTRYEIITTAREYFKQGMRKVTLPGIQDSIYLLANHILSHNKRVVELEEAEQFENIHGCEFNDYAYHTNHKMSVYYNELLLHYKNVEFKQRGFTTA